MDTPPLQKMIQLRPSKSCLRTASSRILGRTAMTERLSKADYCNIDFADPASLLEHAKKLEGHTFQDVLDLG